VDIVGKAGVCLMTHEWLPLIFWSIDNVPVLRHRRPAFKTPNPWSHPFPRFSYENSQIQVEFNSDPSLPSCSEHLYPNESWRYLHFVLACFDKVSTCTLLLIFDLGLCVCHSRPSLIRLLLLLLNGVSFSSLYQEMLLMREPILFYSGLDLDAQ
jgi:hypothetical protein